MGSPWTPLGKQPCGRAIMEARASAEASTIQLPAGTYHLTLVGSGENEGATGDLDIGYRALNIIGAGAATTIVDATGLGDRVFDLHNGDRVVIQGITITGGSLTSDSGDSYERCGAGILSVWGSLVVSNCSLKDNSTSGVYGSGGAIWTSTDLTVLDSTFEDNYAKNTGGAILAAGSDYTITIRNTTFSDNLSTISGGAISVKNGLLSTIEKQHLCRKRIKRRGRYREPRNDDADELYDLWQYRAHGWRNLELWCVECLQQYHYGQLRNGWRRNL